MKSKNNNQLKPQKIISRDFENFDSYIFQNVLIDKIKFLMNNESKIKDYNFDTYVRNINLAIYDSIEITAPKIEKTIKPNWNSRPWISNDIIKKIKNRDQAYYRAKNSKCIDDLENYRKLRNKIVNSIRINKKKFYENKIDKNKHNSRLMWSEIKKLMGDKKTNSIMPNCIKVNDKLLDSKTDIVNEFNNYFFNSV